MEEFNSNIIQPLSYTDSTVTGNIKIRYSEEEDKVYLSSIPITPELNTAILTKFESTSNLGYSMDLALFYSAVKSKTNSFFDNSTQYSSFYKTGGGLLESNLYDENLYYFAPLFIGDDIENLPEFFNICAVENTLLNQVIQKDNYLETLFYNSIPLNSFDIRKNKSALGKYIYEHALNNSKNNYWDVESQSYKTALVQPVSGSVIYPTDIPNNFEFSLETFEIYGLSLNLGVHASTIEMFNRKEYFKENGLTQEQLRNIFKNWLKKSWSRTKNVNPRILNLEFLFTNNNYPDLDLTKYTLCGYYCNSSNSLSSFKDTLNFSLNLYPNIDSTNPYLNKKIETKIFYNLPDNEFYSNSDIVDFSTNKDFLNTNNSQNNFLNVSISNKSLFYNTVDIAVKLIIDDTTQFRYDSELTQVFYEDVVLKETDIFLKISESNPEVNGFYKFDDYFLQTFKKIEYYNLFGNTVVYCTSGKYSEKIYTLKNSNNFLKIENKNLDNPLLEFVEKNKNYSFYGFLNKKNNIDILASSQFIQNTNTLNLKIAGYNKNYPLENVFGTSNKDNFNAFYSQINSAKHRESILFNFDEFKEGDSITIQNSALNRNGNFRWKAIFTDNDSYSLYKVENYTPIEYNIKVSDFRSKIGIENVNLVEFRVDKLKFKDFFTGDECFLTFYGQNDQILGMDTFLVETLYFDELAEKTVFECIDLFNCMKRFQMNDVVEIRMKSLKTPEQIIYFSRKDTEDLSLNLVRTFNTFTNRTYEVERINANNIVFYSKNEFNQKHFIECNFIRSLNSLDSIRFNDISAVSKYKVNIQDIRNYSSLNQTKQFFLYPKNSKYLSKINLFKKLDSYENSIDVSGFNANWEIKVCKIYDVSNNLIHLFYSNNFEWVENYPLRIRISDIDETISKKFELGKQYKLVIEPLNKYNTIIDTLFTFDERLYDNSIIFNDAKINFTEPNGREYILAKEGLSDLQFFDIQSSKIFSLPCIEFDNGGNLIKESVERKYSIFLNNYTYNTLVDYDSYVSARYPFIVKLLKFFALEEKLNWI
jgi:hypothetical protein